jgi:glycosyltransferase involved in cell wall biosynthesis
MSNIIYLLNSNSMTSIPSRWAEYSNNKRHNISIRIITLKRLFSFLLKNNKSYIYHGHHIKVMFLFLLLNTILRKKSVYTVHGSYLFLSRINKILLKFILKYSTSVCFVNKTLYSVLPNNLREIILDKYSIILNGVELEFQYKFIDVYKKYNIGKEDIVLFQPARFVQEKNHYRVIEAVYKAVQINKNIKLILAGDGKLKDEINDQIKKLHLENNVFLIGLITRDEVYCFLKKCDLFLMPSISEGLNIAFLEAMSMKSKVLVSDIEQFTYPFEHYNIDPELYNTYFANALDIESIYKQIILALSKEKNEEFDMSIFSLSNMMDKYNAIYTELIQ